MIGIKAFRVPKEGEYDSKPATRLVAAPGVVIPLVERLLQLGYTRLSAKDITERFCGMETFGVAVETSGVAITLAKLPPHKPFFVPTNVELVQVYSGTDARDSSARDSSIAYLKVQHSSCYGLSAGGRFVGIRPASPSSFTESGGIDDIIVSLSPEERQNHVSQLCNPKGLAAVDSLLRMAGVK